MKTFIALAALVVLSLASSANGTCSSSEVFITNRSVCAAKCTATSTTCGGGTCQGTKCVCEPGYQNTPSGDLCVPVCVRGCVAAGGLCNAPGVCECKDSTQYFDTATLKCVVNADCDGDCYGKLCDASGCKCAPEYTLVEGSCEPTCAGKCDSTKGLACVDPGVCACDDLTHNLNDLGKCTKVTFVTPAVNATA